MRWLKLLVPPLAAAPRFWPFSVLFGAVAALRAGFIVPACSRARACGAGHRRRQHQRRRHRQDAARHLARPRCCDAVAYTPRRDRARLWRHAARGAERGARTAIRADVGDEAGAARAPLRVPGVDRRSTRRRGAARCCRASRVRRARERRRTAALRARTRRRDRRARRRARLRQRHAAARGPAARAIGPRSPKSMP